MKATENYLLKSLSNHDVTFFIPPYQRNYEWTEEQCSAFFGDVYQTTKENIEGKKAEHFFVTIVYVESEGGFGEGGEIFI